MTRKHIPFIPRFTSKVIGGVSRTLGLVLSLVLVSLVVHTSATRFTHGPDAGLASPQPATFVPASDFLGLVKRGHLHPTAYPECQPIASSRLANFTFTLSERPQPNDALLQAPFYSQRHKKFVYPRLQPRWRAIARSLHRTRSFYSGVRYVLAVQQRNRTASIPPRQAMRRTMLRALHYVANAFQSIKYRHARHGVNIFTEMEIEDRDHTGAVKPHRFRSVKLRLKAVPSQALGAHKPLGEKSKTELVGVSMDDWRVWRCCPVRCNCRKPRCYQRPSTHPTGVSAPARQAARRTVSIIQLAELYASMLHRDAIRVLANNSTYVSSGMTRGISITVAFPGWMEGIARAMFIDAIHMQARRQKRDNLIRARAIAGAARTYHGRNQHQQAGVSRKPKYTLVRASVNATSTARVRITRRIRKRVRATLARIAKHLPTSLSHSQPHALPAEMSGRTVRSALVPRSDENKLYAANGTLYLRVEELTEALVIQEITRLQHIRANFTLRRNDDNQKQLALARWQHRVRNTPAYREFIRLTAFFDALVARPRHIFTGSTHGPTNSVCVSHPGFSISVPFELVKKLKEELAIPKNAQTDTAPTTILGQMNRLRLSLVRKVKRVVRRVISYIPLPESWKESLGATAPAPKPAVTVISITHRPLPADRAQAPPHRPEAGAGATYTPIPRNGQSDAELRRQLLEQDHLRRARRQQADIERQRRLDAENTAMNSAPLPPLPNIALGPEALAGIPAGFVNRLHPVPRARETVEVYPDTEENRSTSRRYYRIGTDIVREAPHRHSRWRRRYWRNYIKTLDPGARIVLILISAIAGALFLYAVILLARAFICPSERQRAREGSQMILDDDVEVIVRQDEMTGALAETQPMHTEEGKTIPFAQPDVVAPLDTSVHAPSQADTIVKQPKPSPKKQKHPKVKVDPGRIPASMRTSDASQPFMQDYEPSPTHHAPVMPSLLDEPVTHIPIQPGSGSITQHSPVSQTGTPWEYAGPESHVGQQITTPTSISSGQTGSMVGSQEPGQTSSSKSDIMHDSDVMTDDQPGLQPAQTDSDRASLLEKTPTAVQQLQQQNRRAREPVKRAGQRR